MVVGQLWTGAVQLVGDSGMLDDDEEPGMMPVTLGDYVYQVPVPESWLRKHEHKLDKTCTKYDKYTTTIIETVTPATLATLTARATQVRTKTPTVTLTPSTTATTTVTTTPTTTTTPVITTTVTSSALAAGFVVDITTLTETITIDTSTFYGGTQTSTSSVTTTLTSTEVVTDTVTVTSVSTSFTTCFPRTNFIFKVGCSLIFGYQRSQFLASEGQDGDSRDGDIRVGDSQEDDGQDDLIDQLKGERANFPDIESSMPELRVHKDKNKDKGSKFSLGNVSNHTQVLILVNSFSF